YFSVAPVFGVALSLIGWPEMPSLLFLLAAVMAFGIWLHISERYEHPHTYQVLDHNHRHGHRHDEHHNV
ncbi:EamA family transporter, partial [Paraburkholderia sp. SIMBA_049]